MDDGYRPHKFPTSALEADYLIAWECQACGKWVREYGPQETDECPIDWRNTQAAS